MAFSKNITPRNIYANFLPINAVSGSSFTLIKSSNYSDKDSINLVINLSLKAKNNKFKLPLKSHFKFNIFLTQL